MNDEFVWKSTDPEIIAAFDEWVVARAEFSKDSQRLVRRWFGRKKRGRIITSGIGRPRWIAVEALEGERVNPPVGWRYDNKHGVLVPFRSRKEGKQFAKEMDACQPPLDPKIKGMPVYVMDFTGAGFYSRQPSLAIIDGVAWCWWRIDLKAKRTVKPKTDRWYDPKVWERAKLSEFYAAREAREVA